MERPETKYVAVGDADVAFQVLGNGPPDVLYCYGLGSNIDYGWDIAYIRDFCTRIAAISRLILFDRRGTGASDGLPLALMPTWEEWSEDLGAVLDAAGAREAVLIANLDAGALAILFAALHPERVLGLVLINTFARFTGDDDYPIGYAPGALDSLLALVRAEWGTVQFAAMVNPTTSDNEVLTMVARLLRSSATPRTAAVQMAYILRHLDVRQALQTIQVPTLVLHVRDSLFVPIDFGRYLADHIDGARLVEIPGGDLGVASPMVLEEIIEFLTGKRPEIEVDRVLTTVMFTDIVGSTEQVALLGDKRWRSLLDAHDRVVREELRRFRGKEIKTTGDGFLASFDGPARAIRCARAITEASGQLGIELRVGLHTGECEVRGEDLGGLAVHIAARVGASAVPGEVLVSGTVKDLVVGSGIEFSDRGEHELKGVPGTWRLFAAER